MIQKNFRYDISALRALAVISVVLYHFQVPIFSSGFVGVDIFFVISGFLMTKIIYSACRQGTFSFVGFFFSRAKRIIPALLCMCLFLLVFGWLYLLPIDYRQLSKHVISSLLFISNIILSGESGYFDVASTKKLLLHTWSLSVEWQFYVFLPFVLVGLLKQKVRILAPVVLLVLAVVSFTCALFWSNTQDVYFSLITRAWEMLIGALICFLPTPKWFSETKIKIVTVVLFGGLIFSAVAIGTQECWPNLWALVPVFCTGAIIWLNSDVKLFHWKPINLLGEISYSLYLWHWPVVVFFVSEYQTLSAEIIFVGIGLSTFFAYLSYKYIETPTRKYTPSIKVMFAGVTFLGISGALALSIFVTNGFPFKERLPEMVYKADLEFLNREPRKDMCLTLGGVDSNYCTYGSSEDVSLILFGDSHASAIVSAVEEALPAGKSLLFIAKAGCPSLIEGDIRKKGGGECMEFVAKQLEFVKRSYPNIPVLVVSRWPYYYLGKPELGSKRILAEELRQLKGKFTTSFGNTWCPITKERRVFALSALPEYWANVPEVLAKALWDGDIIANIPKGEYENRSQWVIDGLSQLADDCSITVIDASKPLCDNKECIVQKDSRPIYYDDNHLSEWGNKLLIPVLSENLFL